MYDLDTVSKDLDQIVAERGEDYVYPLSDPAYLNQGGGCLYKGPDGRPACLIGHLLDRYGFLDSIGEGVSFDYGAVPAGLFTDEAIEFLGDVQSYQDRGFAWGDALEKAKELINV